jgi:hypothetical protein
MERAAEDAGLSERQARDDASAALAVAGGDAATEEEAAAAVLAARDGWRLAAGRAALAREAVERARARLLAAGERVEVG